MQRFFLILLPLLSLGIFTSCKHHTPEGKADLIVERIADELVLNKNQEKQLKVISQKIVAEFKANKSKRQARQDQAFQLILSDRITEDQIEEIMQSKQEQREQAVKKFLPEILAFHQTLTSGQKQEAVRILKKLRKRFAPKA